MNELVLALSRKEGVALLVIANALLVDRTFLRRFNTAEILEKHPIAVAVVLAGFIIGIALA
jgi:hypothetical protein